MGDGSGMATAWESCVDRLSSCVERILERVNGLWPGSKSFSSAEMQRMARNATVCCDAKNHGEQVEVSRYCVSGKGTVSWWDI